MNKQFFKDYPIFFRYFIADFVGKVADQYFLVLLPFLIFTVTNDTALLAITLAASAIGRILMLPFGGVIVDRFRPQIFLFGNNVIQFFGLILVLALNYYGMLNLWNIGITALIFGLTDGISLPATSGMIPRLVKKEDLLKANSFIQGLEQLTGVLGPILAGFTIARLGLGWGIAGGIALYLISSIGYFTILYLKTELEQHDTLHWFNDIKKGIDAIKDNPVVLTNIIFTATSNIFLAGSITIGFLLLLRDKFGLGADFYSLTGVFFSLGFVIGFPLVGRIKKIAYPGRMAMLFAAIYCIVFLLFATLPNVWMIMATLTVVGIVVAFDSTISTTWVQSTTPVAVMGRVAAFQVFAMIAVDPVGSAIAGFTAKYGVEKIFYVAAIGYLVIAGLNFIFNPVLRKRYDLDFTHKPEEAK
jgi:MFS transporter, DHA3 family, macrolide efflux protein